MITRTALDEGLARLGLVLEQLPVSTANRLLGDDAAAREQLLSSLDAAAQELFSAPLTPSERVEVLTSLAHFDDPHAALQGVRTAFDDHLLDGTPYLLTLAGGVPDDGSPVLLHPEFAEAVRTIRGPFFELGLTDEHTHAAAAALRSSASPQELALALRSAVATTVTALGGAQYVDGPLVADLARRPEFALAVMDAAMVLTGNPLSAPGLLSNLRYSDDPVRLASGLSSGHDFLLSQGRGFDALNLTALGAYTLDVPDLDSYVFALDWRSAVEQEIREAYTAFWHPEHPSSPGWMARLPHEHLPLLRQRLSDIGLTDDEVTRALDAWLSYDAAAWNQYAKDAGLTHYSDVADVVADQTAKLLGQFVALEDYVREHRIDELHALMDPALFNIRNFDRHPPERLHDQLQRWNAGEPVEALWVTAGECWNGGLPRQSSTWFAYPKQLTVVEADTKGEVGRALVRIGRRERAWGRDPLDRANAVDVLLTAHADAHGMYFTAAGGLTVADFAAAADLRQDPRFAGNNLRPQTFGGHLAISSVHLLGCSSDAPAEAGLNIVQTIAVEYNVTSHGGRRTMQGAVGMLDNGALVLVDDGYAFSESTYLPGGVPAPAGRPLPWGTPARAR